MATRELQTKRQTKKIYNIADKEWSNVHVLTEIICRCDMNSVG